MGVRHLGLRGLEPIWNSKLVPNSYGKSSTYQQKRNRETDKSISGHSPGLKSWRTLGLLESDHRRYCALAALPTSFVGLKRHLKLEFWPLTFSSGDWLTKGHKQTKNRRAAVSFSSASVTWVGLWVVARVLWPPMSNMHFVTNPLSLSVSDGFLILAPRGSVSCHELHACIAESNVILKVVLRWDPS